MHTTYPYSRMFYTRVVMKFIVHLRITRMQATHAYTRTVLCVATCLARSLLTSRVVILHILSQSTVHVCAYISPIFIRTPRKRRTLC